MEKRHGKLQRLLAVLMSLMMALVLLAPSAFADDGSATITINKGSIKKDLTNMTVKAYLVLDQVNPKETTVEKKQYQVTNDFKAFFEMRDGTDKLAENIKGLFGQSGQDVVLTYDGTDNKITFSQVPTGAAAAAGTIVLTGDDAAQLDETYPEADLVSRLHSNSEAAATFYTWVEKYIEARVGTEDEPASYNPSWANPVTSYTNDGSTIQFTGLTEGYYALIFSNVPAGVSAKQGILIATNALVPASMNLKAEEIPLTKQVKNPSVSHNSEDYSDNTTANMGDTLDYKITSKVPTLTDTENLTAFNLSDTMEKQMLTAGNTMTLAVGSATFTANIPTIPTDAQSATANFEDASHNVIAVLTVEPYNDASKTQKFTVDFLANGTNDNWTKYQGDEVTLTYSATLTADAYNINLNTITLTIDNNDDETTQTAETKVYTYGIEVEKTFSDGKKYTGVNGATFALKTAKDGTVIRLVKTSDGTYHKAAANETADQETLYLDANSKLTITGLDEGTYWLEETNAPAGFTKAEPIQIVLVSSSNNKEELDAGASTAKYNGTAGNEDLLTAVTNQQTTSISLGQFKVYNQKGFELPQTGGAGTWMFTVGGIVLIAAAGALFLASRKKRSSK